MTYSDEHSLNPLPQGWVWCRLEDLVIEPQSDIVSGPFGSNLKSSDYMRSGVPVIRLQNVKRNRFVDEDMPYITPQKAEELERHQCASGDIVITKLGDPLGEACLVPDNLDYGVVVADVVRVRIEHEYILKKYLVYAINSDVVIQQLQNRTKGTTRPRVNLDHIRELEIPLAPINEQRRIVEAIETQLSRLDVAVAVLERAQKNLERYKTAMLQAACEGHLVPTEAELAQAEGREYESAEVLLQRILAERRERWEEEQWQREIERAQKKVVQIKRKVTGLLTRIQDIPAEEWQSVTENEYTSYLPKNDLWKKLYREPEPIDTSNLSRLPEGWKWSRLTDLVINPQSDIVSGPFGSNLKASEYVSNGLPVIRLQNVKRNQFVNENIPFVTPQKAEELEKHTFVSGDIVMTKLGDPLGEVCVVPDYLPYGVIVADIVRVRIGHNNILKEYLVYAMNSEVVAQQLKSQVKGTTRPRVNLSHARDLLIPLPPMAEQFSIVKEIEKKLSLLTLEERLIEDCFSRSTRLQCTVLKRAFEGMLVFQDPADIPASVLLALIEAERTKRELQTKTEESKPKRRKPVKTSTEQRSLYDVLVEAAAQLVPEDLFRRAGFNESLVDEFFEEVRREIVAGRIEEVRSNDTYVYLKVVQDED